MKIECKKNTKKRLRSPFNSLESSHMRNIVLFKLNELGSFGVRVIRCESEEEAKVTRKEEFANHIDIGFAVLLTEKELQEAKATEPALA